MITFSITLLLKHESGPLYQRGVVGVQADDRLSEILHHGKVYSRAALYTNEKNHPETEAAIASGQCHGDWLVPAAAARASSGSAELQLLIRGREFGRGGARE